MHIADDDDTNASESVVSSYFEDEKNTCSPVYAQLSFHMIDRHGKLLTMYPIGQSIHCPPIQRPIPTLKHPSVI